MTIAYVLMSGGIDSTTALYEAIYYNQFVHAISIDYGQRHKKEIEYAKWTCDREAILHEVIDLSSLMRQYGTMLTDPEVNIPAISYDEIKGVSPTYVPFRNGLLLSAVAARIVQNLKKMGLENEEDAAVLYWGAHAEDAQNWAYPDCTPEFSGAMANAIYIGTYRAVRLVTPFQYMKKSEIIQRGEAYGIDWANTWSCYAGGEHHCGVCPTCRARQDAFRKAGVNDPTTYAA